MINDKRYGRREIGMRKRCITPLELFGSHAVLTVFTVVYLRVAADLYLHAFTMHLQGEV